MSTLNDFISSVKAEGLARTNRFLVRIAVPPILNGTTDTVALRKLELYCETAQLPGLSLSTQQARTFGEFREMPYERLFDNITLTFMIDNTFDTKAFFDSWINSVQKPGSRTFNYYSEYTSSIDIIVLDSLDAERYSVKLYECYPKAITPIGLDYGSKEVMKLQVSINYRYWESSTASAQQVTNEGPNVSDASLYDTNPQPLTF